MDIVISARVPEKELRLLKQKGINVSEIVRASIVEAAEKEKSKESEKALENAAKIMKKIKQKYFVRSVRDDRDATH